MSENFNKNVFLNCPLDKEYKPLLRTLLFTIYSCNFIPRIASERLDSGESRLEKIKDLILSSKYSIHDLSRIKADKEEEYYRLNMPFEIGLDLGCRYFNNDPKYRNKKCLILEKEKYSYQKGLSDLSGVDVKCHEGDPYELVIQVRHWFTEIGIKGLDCGSNIWDNFNVCHADFYEQKTSKGFKDRDFDKLPVPEFNDYIIDWIKGRK